MWIILGKTCKWRKARGEAWRKQSQALWASPEDKISCCLVANRQIQPEDLYLAENCLEIIFLKQWTITCTGALSTSEQFVEQLPMSTIFLILVLSLIFQFAIAAILISALTFQLFSTMKQMKYFHFHFSSEAMFNWKWYAFCHF